MSSVIYQHSYVCISINADNPVLCDAWQQVHQGNYITPELAGQIILFAFILNIVVYGFVTIKRVM